MSTDGRTVEPITIVSFDLRRGTKITILPELNFGEIWHRYRRYTEDGKFSCLYDILTKTRTYLS